MSDSGLSLFKETNMNESILYVDVENLQDIAKQTLISAMNSWPSRFPKPGIIRLYVQADQTELWRIWAHHQIPGVEIAIKGVQHFTTDGSKNSADISIALDALTDILKNRTKFVAIMSDDSDYAILFSVFKQEINLTEESKVPFKWFMTDRRNTRSSVLSDFFPSEYVYLITTTNEMTYIEEETREKPNNEKPKNENDNIARSIIQNIKVGSFKSSDCKKLILKMFPNNSLAKLDSAAFGTQFSKIIWPNLRVYGVQLSNPNRKPRKYEMTDEAKKRIGT
jgi:hypothetical protein